MGITEIGCEKIEDSKDQRNSFVGRANPFSRGGTGRNKIKNYRKN